MVTETEIKQYTFTEGSVVIVKKFTSPTVYSYTLQVQGVNVSLTSDAFANLYDAVIAAYNQNYEPDYGPQS